MDISYSEYCLNQVNSGICHALTPHLAGSMAVPLAGSKALRLSLTSESESQSFESCEQQNTQTGPHVALGNRHTLLGEKLNF